MRYLFRGLIRESGKTVEGAVEAETPEDALTALSSNGIVTEDLTPAPMPISQFAPSRRADFAPATAGNAGAPPVPQNGNGNGHHAGGSNGYVPAENVAHPGLNSDDPVERAFAAASQAVSFDAVAQRYKGKSVWVIDRDRIRRQVAGIVDQALQAVETKQKDSSYDGDMVRESVAAALKEMFKDNRNIASQKTPEEAKAAAEAERAAQAGSAPPQPAQAQRVVADVSPRLEAQIDRLEAFFTRAETVLTQLQVAAKRVGTGGGGGGGGGGFAPRRMSHIPKPRNDEQNSVLMEIFKSNVKLRENLAAKDKPAGEPVEAVADAAESEAVAEPATA